MSFQKILSKTKLEISYSNFKTYYKATIIKKKCDTSVNTDILTEWNTTDYPKINPHIYAQMIFDKGVKIIQQGKR